MSDKVKPRISRGLRDLMPQQVLARQWMINTIRSVYERYGFLPIETPAVEYLDVLLGSQAGDEASKSIFRVSNPEDEALGLRFDLTVPLARVVAQAKQNLTRPFRRYQVASVWRGDKPDKGRYREFTQFDLDSVGTKPPLADTEIMAGMCDTLRALGVPSYRVRFSSRGVLNVLLTYAGIPPQRSADVFRVLDKLDKVGIEKVKLELGEGYVDTSGDPIRGLGLEAGQVECIAAYLTIPADDRATTLEAIEKLFHGTDGAEEALGVVGAIHGHLEALGYGNDQVVLDPSIARGLAYYTGPVFEAILPDAPQFGSIFGGGRYDGLVQRFSGEAVPAVGASIGVDRLLAALEHLEAVRAPKSTAQVLVTRMDRSMDRDYLTLAHELRAAGINTELYLGNAKAVGKQLKYADRWEIPLALLYGEDEKARAVVQLKDMDAGRRQAEQLEGRDQWLAARPGQREVARADLATTVRALLDEIKKA
jgi:histidyl-tRNA synthetase